MNVHGIAFMSWIELEAESHRKQFCTGDLTMMKLVVARTSGT